MWDIVICVGGVAIITLLMYNKVKNIWMYTQVYKAQKKMQGICDSDSKSSTKKYKPKTKLEKNDVMFR
jgi:hypothetical protein